MSTDSQNLHPYLTAPLPELELSAEYCHRVTRFVADHLVKELKDQLLMLTIHGSLLYGTAVDTPEHRSDIDLRVVTMHGPNKKITTPEADVQVLSFNRFVKLCSDGSHQAVEQLYSPYTVYGDNKYAHMYRPFLEHLEPAWANYVMKAISAAHDFRRPAGTSKRSQVSQQDPVYQQKMRNHADRLEHDAALTLHAGPTGYTPVYREF